MSARAVHGARTDRGHEADARTDIFAFGALLYEMLTGKKAFEGKSQASLIGAILKDQPPPVFGSFPSRSRHNRWTVPSVDVS